MPILLFLEMFGVEFTVREIIVGVIVLVLGLAGFIKALKEIRTEGWEPFREKWITPVKARRKRMDQLIGAVDGLKGTCESISAELTTNGGKTLKDMVIDTHRKVEHIQARVKVQDETSKIPTFELDEKANLTFANCAFRELVNADLSELDHRKYCSRVHPDDRARFLREIGESISNLMPLDSTVRFRLDQHNFALVHMVALPDVRPGGDLMGYFGTAAQIQIVS